MANRLVRRSRCGTALTASPDRATIRSEADLDHEDPGPEAWGRMTAQQTLDQVPILIVFLAFGVLGLLVYELGFRVGRWRRHGGQSCSQQSRANDDRPPGRSSSRWESRR